MIEKYVDGDVINLTASADITEGQVVELTGDEQVAPTSAASTKVIGVAVISALNGEKVAVRTRGVVKVTAAGAITAGSKVVSAAAGKVAAASSLSASVDAGSTTVTSTAANGNIITLSGGVLPEEPIGKALTSASADGDEITILLEVV